MSRPNVDPFPPMPSSGGMKVHAIEQAIIQIEKDLNFALSQGSIEKMAVITTPGPLAIVLTELKGALAKVGEMERELVDSRRFLVAAKKDMDAMRAKLAAAQAESERLFLGGVEAAETIARLRAQGSVELEILDFAVAQWGEKNMAGIGLKLGEEAGEIAGALVKIPEGRATAADLDKELGDILIVLSQLAAKRGTTLTALRSIRFDQIKKRALTPAESSPNGEVTGDDHNPKFPPQ